jgi:hypothetical protein
MALNRIYRSTSVGVGRYDMTPALFLGAITAVLGALAALNYFYFENMPLTKVFTFLSIIALSIAAFTFFYDDDD